MGYGTVWNISKMYEEFEREPTVYEELLMDLVWDRRLEEKYGKNVEIRICALDLPTVKWVREGGNVKMVLSDYLVGAEDDVCMDIVEHVLKAISGDPQDGYPESVKEWFESPECYKVNIDKYLVRNCATIDMIPQDGNRRLYRAFDRARSMCGATDLNGYDLHISWAKNPLPNPIEVSNIFNTVLVDRRLLKASEELLTYQFCRAIGELMAESMFVDHTERKALAAKYTLIWDADVVGELLKELKELMSGYDMDEME